MPTQEMNREMTRTEVDEASETLHHVIDSGRQMFRAGERVIDEIDHLWHTSKRVESGAQGSRARRLWIIGIMAGVCLAVAARMRSR